MSNDTTGSGPTAADSPFAQAVALRWKHAVAVFVVGTATYALYQVGGGWTVDAAVFGLGTLALAVYSAATYTEDVS
jgi:hypothetical protein